MGENELTSTEILRKFTVCFVEFTPNSEVLIQVTKPNGEVAETGTISTDASGEGWWDYRILSGEPLGIYKITLAQGNSRTEGAIEIVPATYPRMILLSPRDGSPGDSFLFSFAGFQPNQSLYLWHEVNYSEGWIYWTTLPQPAVDERGEGIYTLHTLPNDPTGCYMVSTDGHGSIYSDPVFCIW
ncbi:MAG: hypothetical protein JW981_04320 [Anaerolineae bacterium]|nr:hypothetical protein [Anaerolineae bacterium]